MMVTRLQRVDPRQAVLILIAVVTALHVISAASVGLANDEAYTVSNARIFSLSYVDYPPLHVWLVGAWCRLVHSESALAARLPFVLIFAGSTWLMFSFTSFLFGDRAGFWAALAYNASPVYAISHGDWVLPDGPLSFFMLAGAWAIARQLFAKDHPSTAISGWLMAGLLAGLAMLSKYHGVFLVAGTFVFLLAWRPGRSVLASPAPWLAVCLVLIVFLPVLAWNAEHGWIGLFFQSQRLTRSVNPSVVRVLMNIIGQAAYLAPWIFAPLCLVLWRGLRSGPKSRETWYLSLLAIGPIAFFTVASLFAKGLPHWSMPGWLFTFPMLGEAMTRWENERPRAVYAAATAALIATSCLVAAFVSQANSGWITSGFPPSSVTSDPTLDLLSWQEAREAIQRHHLIDSSTTAVAGTRWMDTAKLNYELGKTIPILCLCDDPQQFRFLNDPARFAGQNIIVIQTRTEFAKHGAKFARWFHSLKPLPPIILHRRGRDALMLLVFRGIKLRDQSARAPGPA